VFEQIWPCGSEDGSDDPGNPHLETETTLASVNQGRGPDATRFFPGGLVTSMNWRFREGTGFLTIPATLNSRGNSPPPTGMVAGSKSDPSPRSDYGPTGNEDGPLSPRTQATRRTGQGLSGRGAGRRAGYRA